MKLLHTYAFSNFLKLILSSNSLFERMYSESAQPNKEKICHVHVSPVLPFPNPSDASCAAPEETLGQPVSNQGPCVFKWRRLSAFYLTILTGVHDMIAILCYTSQPTRERECARAQGLGARDGCFAAILLRTPTAGSTAACAAGSKLSVTNPGLKTFDLLLSGAGLLSRVNCT